MQKISVDEVLTLTLRFIPPVLPGENPAWSEPQETRVSAEREKRRGTLTTFIRTARNWELRNEEFRSDDGKLMLFSAKLKNCGSTVKTVERLSAFGATCNLDGAACHCGKRLKHEKPYSFIMHDEEFDADPLFLASRPAGMMMASWVQTHWHPARIRMRSNPDTGNYFENQILSADADFHGQEIPPGATLTTATLAIRLGEDYNALLREHAGAICSFYQVAPKKHAPYVLSSWHYWGKLISEEIVEAELRAAETRGIPGEVYQVDAGYHTLFGDWLETNERFSHGLQALAAQIARHKMIPGIWLAPFMVNPESKTAKAHPEWILRKKDGSPVCYKVSQACQVLDLSLPAVRQWLEATFRALREAGFLYFKIDFTRSFFTDEFESRLCDRMSNLTMSYRAGLEAVRSGIGKDAFLNVCGGHGGCLAGLADSQRTGADTYARWQSDNPTPAWHRIRQGMFRAWQGAWRYNDPDAAAIRLCNTPLDDTPHGHLSLGDLTGKEAELMVLHQFLAGGVPASGENFQELQEERLKMMRRVVPSCGIPADLLDPFNPLCPSRFVTKFPERNGLSAQSIVSALNVTEENDHPYFTLDEKTVPAPAEMYAVWDMTHDRLIGFFRKGEEFPLGTLLPHSAAVAAVTPLAKDAVIVGSDGHYGFAEIAGFSACGTTFSGRIRSRWRYPVRLSAAIPSADGKWEIHSATLTAQSDFDGKLF